MPAFMDRALAESLVEALRRDRATVTTIESLTGGMISAAIVAVPGASEVLREAYVTYSNEAKERLANVSGETLARHGAVSSEVAEEMAEGGRRAASAEVGIAATGIAGPDGGTEEKPVGLVWIGCSVRGQVRTKRLLINGTREGIRKKTTEEALAFALACLANDKEKRV